RLGTLLSRSNNITRGMVSLRVRRWPRPERTAKCLPAPYPTIVNAEGNAGKSRQSFGNSWLDFAIMRTCRRGEMPNAEVMFFQEAEARSPLLLEWLDRLPQKARIKCLAT